MKVKPKDVTVSVPAVHVFAREGEDAQLASNFNTFLHGKVQLKYEELGMLGGQYVSIFYFQRNNEFTELREQFMELILQEEMNRPPSPPRKCGCSYALCRGAEDGCIGYDL